jgi:hypothetical protein
MSRRAGPFLAGGPDPVGPQQRDRRAGVGLFGGAGATAGRGPRAGPVPRPASAELFRTMFVVAPPRSLDWLARRQRMKRVISRSPPGHPPAGFSPRSRTGAHPSPPAAARACSRRGEDRATGARAVLARAGYDDRANPWPRPRVSLAYSYSTVRTPAQG